MSWLIRLSGNKDALDLLGQSYSSDHLSVSGLGGEFWLQSNTLSPDLSRQETYEKGQDLVVFLNTMLKLYTRRPDQIESDGYCQLEPDGNITEKFKVVTGPSTLPMRLVSVGEALPEEDIFSLYKAYPNVRYALVTLNQEKLDWYSLFSVYETIASDKEVLKIFLSFDAALKRWGKDAEKGRFLGTAGWHRHSEFGTSKGKVNRPPKTPMKLAEAENFVRGVTMSWLSFKAEKPNKRSQPMPLRGPAAD